MARDRAFSGLDNQIKRLETEISQRYGNKTAILFLHPSLKYDCWTLELNDKYYLFDKEFTSDDVVSLFRQCNPRTHYKKVVLIQDLWSEEMPPPDKTDYTKEIIDLRTGGDTNESER